jgi:hypothetical protein
MSRHKVNLIMVEWAQGRGAGLCCGLSEFHRGNNDELGFRITNVCLCLNAGQKKTKWSLFCYPDFLGSVAVRKLAESGPSMLPL